MDHHDRSLVGIFLRRLLPRSAASPGFDEARRCACDMDSAVQAAVSRASESPLSERSIDGLFGCRTAEFDVPEHGQRTTNPID